MAHRPRSCAITIALFAATWLVACSSHEPDYLPDVPADGSDGGGPAGNPTPVGVAPGEYLSPAGYPEAREKGRQTESAEAGQPVFEGEINGIALRKLAPENFPDYCGEADFDRFDPTEILKFAYLPPGTAVVTPQQAAVCPDGTKAVVEEEFAGANFLFEIYLRQGAPVALHEAPQSRVSAVTINGLAGVVVKPLTTDGYGASQVAWVTPGGMLQVTASDLPWDQVMKIAEGIQCADC